MKKFNDFTNESIRDQMTPASEDDIRNKMGEEKFDDYKLLLDIKDFMNKPPFSSNKLFTKEEPISLKIYTEWNSFEIKISSGNYILDFVGNHGLVTIVFDTWNDTFEKIKEVSNENVILYEKQQLKKIDDIRKEIKNVKEDYEKINENYK